ncbi:DUF2500 domain-containing protein [Peribacillus alkalitolerans]|uniref:DUF2500 domain-containing protein n=1 Tax=Peribacillus alkalitolerans TaxID=1550385 RepID=UPI0013D66C9C|nr:DUF2500 domain-containing protein [Peribacillus alkalitolerans]
MNDPFMDDGFFFGDFMFTIFPIIFGIIFVIVIGTILFTIFKSVGQWNKNNKAPRLSVPAVVKTKRSDVRGHSHSANDHATHHTSTSYFVTFEVESGDRIELILDGSQYGMIAEGDAGILSFQGTRFLGFER